MGLLDDRMIDYYDSTVQKTIPKQKWMKEKLQQEYWDKCTQSRQSKQQWFKVNIDILINRMRQTSNDTHVLQWMHGCEGEEDEQGNLQFKRGMDMYYYDGEHLLHFDDEHEVWVAVETKRKWDEVTALKDYTNGYLEKEKCMNCMKILLECSNEQLRKARFYPKDITLNIRRDGRVLTRDDGVMSSGVRPNHDETFQRTDYVEILRSDSANYTCEVSHPASDMHVVKTWDHRLPDEENHIAVYVGVGVVVFGLLGLGYIIVFFVVQKRGIFGRKYQPTKNKDPEDMNSGPVIKAHLTKEDKDSGSSLDSKDSAISGCN